MILRSLVTAIRRLPGAKAAFLAIYLLNLLAALIVALPLRAGLIRFSGDTLMSERLVNGLDLDFLYEFLSYNAAIAPALLGLMILVLAIYLSAALFFSAGAFSQLEGEGVGFWSGAARHFGTFVRILFWSIPAALLLGLGFAALLGVRRLVLGPDPLQNVSFWTNLATALVLLFLVGLLLLMVDFARAEAVSSGDRRARRAVLSAVRNIWRHPVATVGFLLTCSLLGLLSLLLYRMISSGLPQSIAAGLMLPLVLQQSLMLVRTALRLIRYGGTLELNREFAAARSLLLRPFAEEEYQAGSVTPEPAPHRPSPDNSEAPSGPESPLLDRPALD